MRDNYLLASKLWNRCTISSSGCWEWTGSKNQKGYGYSKFGGGKAGVVHVKMYQLSVGDIPDRHQLHHTCLNKACCNPTHLKSMSAMEHSREHSLLRTNFKCGHPFVEDNFVRMKPKMDGWNRVIVCKTCHSISRDKYRSTQKGRATRAAEYQREKDKRALLKSGSIV